MGPFCRVLQFITVFVTCFVAGLLLHGCFLYKLVRTFFFVRLTSACPFVHFFYILYGWLRALCKHYVEQDVHTRFLKRRPNGGVLLRSGKVPNFWSLNTCFLMPAKTK